MSLRRALLRLASGAFCVIGVLLGPVRALRRAVSSAPTLSLWAGAPIISLAINARAERGLGVNARSLVFHTYYVTDAFDYDLSNWRRVPIFGPAVTYAVFLWACVFVDRLHFYCDRGLLPSPLPLTFDRKELLVYRLLGIPVFLWTYGADVRSREATLLLGEPNCCTDCTLVGRACACDERRRQENLSALARLATAVFSMGDMIEYTPGSRNDLFFWPVDLGASEGRRYAPSFPDGGGNHLLRIVHAPNHRMFKGTRFLEKAVGELVEEGVAVELVMVERIPNAEALEIYRSADFIVDQCLVGFHGFFALEGMALGKPVMAFIRKPAQYLLHPEECPLINTHVLTLKEDIRRLAADRAALAEAGRRGRAYVERHFTLQAFAGRLREAYRDMGIRE